MHTKLILLLLPLLASTAHARILRWQTSKMSSTTYDISNKNASNSFLNESNWRVVDPVTGTISTKMAVLCIRNYTQSIGLIWFGRIIQPNF